MPTAKRLGFQTDVTDFNQSKEFVKQVKEKWGAVDILVNNAGITRDKLAAMMSEKDWDDVLDTNLKGVFNVTKPVIGLMIRQRRGAILNITSISGIIGMPGQINYSSSKAGVIGFTKALAKELAKAQVTVNALAPGFVETDMTAVLNEEYKAKALEQVPLGRFASPRKWPKWLCFCFRKRRATSRQVIQVDGGLRDLRRQTLTSLAELDFLLCLILPFPVLVRDRAGFIGLKEQDLAKTLVRKDRGPDWESCSQSRP